MLTPREALIGWAQWNAGYAAHDHGGADWSRASAMLEEVEESTRTPADCLRFYLKWRSDYFQKLTWRERWHHLRHEVFRMERDPGLDTPFIRRLVQPFQFSHSHIDPLLVGDQVGRPVVPLPLP